MRYAVYSDAKKTTRRVTVTFENDDERSAFDLVKPIRPILICHEATGPLLILRHEKHSIGHGVYQKLMKVGSQKDAQPSGLIFGVCQITGPDRLAECSKVPVDWELREDEIIIKPPADHVRKRAFQNRHEKINGVSSEHDSTTDDSMTQPIPAEPLAAIVAVASPVEFTEDERRCLAIVERLNVILGDVGFEPFVENGRIGLTALRRVRIT